MIDLRCPRCNALLLRFDPGEGVEGYCPKAGCKLEIQVRRRYPQYIVDSNPNIVDSNPNIVDSNPNGDLTAEANCGKP